jgi:phage gp36-like protein
MAWISITTSDVQTRLTGPELSATQQVALASGQTNPLPEIIEQVVDEIRGYIAAYGGNTLGSGTTIPQKLLGAALAMIRYRLATRLPVRSLLTQERVDENREAIRLLERVADGGFRIEEPTEADTETHAAPSPQIEAPDRNFSATGQDGV